MMEIPGAASYFDIRQLTVPTAEILTGKNVRAWVSMVLYLKKIKIKLKY